MVDIIAEWHPLSQSIFLLIALMLLFGLAHRALYYVAVVFRGWPSTTTGTDNFDRIAKDSDVS